jgi:type VI secretion system secreted protein VgrG
MRGSQTAVVVGPKGEEIYTDPLGRVKVQFHWDRKGAFDERSSCWIRVMQPWAGNGYGQIWIPRIGQEVIVDFLEGDPDRPIITGCVYNAKNLPPYRLPDYQTVSGVKSRSSKGGDHSSYNEIRIEDKTGAELLVLHAQRDMEIEVKRDTREEVQRDRHLKVHRDQIEQAEGAWHNTVGGDHRESVGGSRSTKIGGDCQTQVGGNCHIEAGGEIHLKAGGRIVLEAASISFLLSGQSGGSSFVDVTAGGVRIQGPMVWINCGLPAPGPASAAALQSPQLPAVPGPPPAPSLPPAFGAPPGGGGASRPAGASGSTSAGAAITPPGGVAGGQGGP